MMASPRTTPMKSRFERSAGTGARVAGSRVPGGVCQHLSPYPLFGQTWCFFTGGTMYVNNLLPTARAALETDGISSWAATRRRRKTVKMIPHLIPHLCVAEHGAP
jgi:hypothetical protein